MLLEILKLLLLLHTCFLILASIAIFFNKVFKLPAEIFRKLLHIIAVFTIIPIVLPSNSWIASLFVCVIFVIEAFVVMRLSGMEKNLKMEERKKGEQQYSMILLYMTYAAMISVGWGFFGQKLSVIVSIFAWGFGDAMAAIIGKNFGKHKLEWKGLAGTKSIEGTIAMFITSIIIVSITLFLGGSIMSWWGILFSSFFISIATAGAELFSRNGTDTFWCPLAAMIVLVTLMITIGGI